MADIKKLKITLQNCYWIKQFDEDFDFESCKNKIIYAPNGSMKSSFAKSLDDLSNWIEPKDYIFTNRGSSHSVLNQDWDDVSDKLLVIHSYNDSFSAERVSSLLVEESLAKRYEAIVKEIDKKEVDLMRNVNTITSLRNSSADLYSDLNVESGHLIEVINALDHIDLLSIDLTTYKYKELFNDKSLAFLKSIQNLDELRQYSERYSLLISQSKYLKKWVFNHYNINNVWIELEKNNYFQAWHQIQLSTWEVIGSKALLEEKINNEKNEILKDPELVSLVDTINSNIDWKKEVRLRREILLANPDLFAELSDIELLKKKYWKIVMVKSNDYVISYVDEFRKWQTDLASVFKEATDQSTTRDSVLEEFNRRFYVPFVLDVKNKENVILKWAIPILEFKYIDESTWESEIVSHDMLLNTLSQWEKRALYILNVLFLIETLKESWDNKVLIIDDIADSFDYKNKYAIIEYLNDIINWSIFQSIILTHNYDFHRTVRSRLWIIRGHSYEVTKSDQWIDLVKEKYLKNPFNHWIWNWNTNYVFFFAGIPFIRNICEYLKDDVMYEYLTNLLHIKPVTKDILLADIQNQINSNFDQYNVDLERSVTDFENAKYLETILTLWEELADEWYWELKLEWKIVISLVIRLLAELYIEDKCSHIAALSEVDNNQTRGWFEIYRDNFPGDSEAISILNRVLIMTSENIHVNSFMYEPIIDLSDYHLRTLYNDVKTLIV